MTARFAEPSFTELFTPKLVTVLRERYGLADFKADVIAGLTVAIVALPLSMAIAVASGVGPERGLYTSIVGGFFVSALGGSRFQIGGPAGAFIVLVAATVQRYGFDGLVLATFLSGLILLAIGLLRLGTFIRYIPYPVTVGFTSGIAIIIFASQLRELLGLSLNGLEPGPLLPKLAALSGALPTFTPSAVAIAGLVIVIIVALRRYRPHWPNFLIAVGAASIAAWLFNLPAATIGSQFGGIPQSLPSPHLPDLSPARIVELLPAALSFALLGGIESLLSAVVADSMSGRRHRSNCELAAQGIANLVSALFGGICVTGTIARTANECPGRRPRSDRRHAAFRLPARLHTRRGTPRELHPAFSPRRRPRHRLLEHGGKDRIHDPPARLARRRGRAARDVSHCRFPRSDRGHPRGLRPRRAAFSASHGASGDGRKHASAAAGRQGRRKRRKSTL